MNPCNRIYLIALLTIVLWIPETWGQTYKNVEITPRSAVGGNAQELNLYTSQFLQTNTPATNSVSNEVFVHQIGNYNKFSADVQSSFGSVTAYQFGDQNETFISKKAIGIREHILQNGDNNIFYDIGVNPELLYSGRVIQSGSNQKLYVLGNNSLSNRMRINMRGNNQTVIIRNVSRQ